MIHWLVWHLIVLESLAITGASEIRLHCLRVVLRFVGKQEIELNLTIVDGFRRYQSREILPFVHDTLVRVYIRAY